MNDQFSDDGPARPALRLEMDPAAHGVGGSTRGGRSDYAPGLGEAEVHLLDYVRVLYKRRWTAITSFLLIVVSTTVYTFTATPIFEAKTRLLIEADNPNVVSFMEVINEERARADYYQTQYSLLQSRALARKTLESLNLWGTPPFGGAAAVNNDAGFSLSGTVSGALSYVASYVVSGLSRTEEEVAKNATPGADETAAQSAAIDGFLSNLSVTPIRNSRLVDLQYRLPDAALAARIVNALARNYIEQNLEYKFLASKEASDWLGERLAEQRQQVEAAEVKLQQYREQNDAISLQSSENIVVQKLTDLNAAVTQAKTERFRKEAVYTQLQALRGNSAALDTFPAILTNTFIQQQRAEQARLQSQYAQMGESLGERHPDMQKIRSAIDLARANVDGEIGNVVQAVRNEYQAALAQENSLVAALNQQKTDALAMNRKAITYNVLERDVQSNKQIYESLMQRAKETGVSSELKTGNIRIVDEAERPRSPASPRKQVNMLLALAAGGMFAFGLAFFFEYIDSRIKSPDEIRQHLGLPFLGLLPELSQKNLTGTYPLLSNGVPPNFSEAFRTIRTNVLFSSAQPGSRSLVVTSTGHSEGKSVVASNLAIAMAQAGQRVLLIDADMRKSSVHKILGIAQEPGLSNLLVGNTKASESVRKSGVAGLWVLAAGRTPPNPAELIGSQRFRDFLASLNEHFDWVVVDSPPVMAVIDAALAAHSVSGVLFVVGAERTSRHAAQRALDQLEQVQAKFIGAVLNRVDLERNAYYYSQYYRREYSDYYQKDVQT
jgi:capsular exopolysaccharide synthesis family protein